MSESGGPVVRPAVVENIDSQLYAAHAICQSNYDTLKQNIKHENMLSLSERHGAPAPNLFVYVCQMDVGRRGDTARS